VGLVHIHCQHTLEGVLVRLALKAPGIIAFQQKAEQCQGPFLDRADVTYDQYQ